MCGYQLCWNLGHASLFNSLKKGILLASPQIHIWPFIAENYTFRMKTFFFSNGGNRKKFYCTRYGVFYLHMFLQPTNFWE